MLLLPSGPRAPWFWPPASASACGPLTASAPKPLIEVAGRALIDHNLDRLERAGVELTVVNVHYLADLVRVHVAKRRAPPIVISDERTALLDTGGGIAEGAARSGAASVLSPQLRFVLDRGRAAEPRLDGVGLARRRHGRAAAGRADRALGRLPRPRRFPHGPGRPAGAPSRNARSRRSSMPAPRSCIRAFSPARRRARSR